MLLPLFSVAPTWLLVLPSQTITLDAALPEFFIIERLAETVYLKHFALIFAVPVKITDIMQHSTY